MPLSLNHWYLMLTLCSSVHQLLLRFHQHHFDGHQYLLLHGVMLAPASSNIFFTSIESAT